MNGIRHLRLDEAQTLAVFRGAAPLVPADREAFFAAVAELLEGQGPRMKGFRV